MYNVHCTSLILLTNYNPTQTRLVVIAETLRNCNHVTLPAIRLATVGGSCAAKVGNGSDPEYAGHIATPCAFKCSLDPSWALGLLLTLAGTSR